MLTVFLNSVFISCTDDDEIVKDDTKAVIKNQIQSNAEDCCDGDGEILPPPPPPPPTNP